IVGGHPVGGPPSPRRRVWWPQPLGAVSTAGPPAAPRRSVTGRQPCFVGPIRRSSFVVHHSAAPLAVALVEAAHDIVVEAVELAGERAGAVRAQGDAVDLPDRRDLGGGAAEEDLVGDVELGAVDLALDDAQVQPLAAEA